MRMGFSVIVSVLGLISVSGMANASVQDSKALHVVAFGDQGSDVRGQREVGKVLATFCKKTGCDHGLILGDNFYPAGVKTVEDPRFKTQFEDIYAALGIPFYISLGNHDYGYQAQKGNPQAQVDYTNHSQAWKMPARYYSFKSENVEFFALDTMAYPNERAQREWLVQGLANSTADFKIVYGHHPIYSYGLHGNTSSMVKGLLPVLCGKADLYLSGHDHDMQVLKAECGLPMAVAGSGADVRPTKKGPRSLFARSVQGFAHLEVNGRQATLQMIGIDGASMHSYDLSK